MFSSAFSFHLLIHVFSFLEMCLPVHDCHSAYRSLWKIDVSLHVITFVGQSGSSVRRSMMPKQLFFRLSFYSLVMFFETIFTVSLLVFTISLIVWKFKLAYFHEFHLVFSIFNSTFTVIERLRHSSSVISDLRKIIGAIPKHAQVTKNYYQTSSTFLNILLRIFCISQEMRCSTLKCAMIAALLHKNILNNGLNNIIWKNSIWTSCELSGGLDMVPNSRLYLPCSYLW